MVVVVVDVVSVIVVTLAHRFKVYSTIQVIFGGLLIIRSLYLFECAVSLSLILFAVIWCRLCFVLANNLDWTFVCLCLCATLSIEIRYYLHLLQLTHIQ